MVPENLEKSVFVLTSIYTVVNSLEKESWKFFPLLFGAPRSVDHVHLNFVHELHGGNWDSCSHDFRSRRCGISYRWKGDDRNTGFLRYDGKLERNFGDKPKRAFGANEQIRKVIASR